MYRLLSFPFLLATAAMASPLQTDDAPKAPDGPAAHESQEKPPISFDWRVRMSESYGVRFHFDNVTDFLFHPDQGTNRNAAIIGRLVGYLDLDLSKGLGFRGTSVHVNSAYEYGKDLLFGLTHSYDPISSMAAPPTLRLNELYLEQSLASGRITVRVGQIAAQNEFNNQYMGPMEGAAYLSWINNSLCCNPSITSSVSLPFTPAAKPGIFLRGDPNRHWFAKAGVFSGSRQVFSGDESGTRFDLRDAPVLAAEVGWRPKETTDNYLGTYVFGWLHNYGNYSTPSDGATKGASLVYLNAGQRVYSVAGSGGRRGVDLQSSFSAVSSSRLRNRWEAIAGVRYVGLFARRPSDIVTVGFISSRLRDSSGPHPEQYRTQTNWELSYRIQVSPSVSIQPDLQYVQTPNGVRGRPNLPVYGIRIANSF